MKTSPYGSAATVISPSAAACGAGGGGAWRRLSFPRRAAGGAGGGGGGGGGLATRPGSTGAATGGGPAALFLPSARYPPTPAATSTSAPTTIPTFDRFFFSAGIVMPARGIGVVGALVTSVGASADAFRAGGGGRRWLLAAPALGTATGCSGHTAVANSSIVGKRWSGSLDSARVIAAVRNGGVSLRFAPALGTSSKMCL